MTMQGKMADMKLTTEQATGAPQNLALSICRRPIVSETVSRVLGRACVGHCLTEVATLH